MNVPPVAPTQSVGASTMARLATFFFGGVLESGRLLPVRRLVFLLCWLFQGNLGEDQPILPAHHPHVLRIGAVPLNELVHTQIAQDAGRVGRDLNS